MLEPVIYPRIYGEKTSIIVKACHKSLMTLTPLATTTEGVMYHLDFESLGQPLCKAGGILHVNPDG